LVDVLHHVHHHPRRALCPFVVGGELQRVERRPLAPDVTVRAPHAEPEGEAPHGGDQLLLADRLGQDFQIGERIGRKLSLRWEGGGEGGAHYDETDGVAHRPEPLVSNCPTTRWRISYVSGCARSMRATHCRSGSRCNKSRSRNSVTVLYVPAPPSPSPAVPALVLFGHSELQLPEEAAHPVAAEAHNPGNPDRVQHEVEGEDSG